MCGKIKNASVGGATSVRIIVVNSGCLYIRRRDLGRSRREGTPGLAVPGYRAAIIAFAGQMCGKIWNYARTGDAKIYGGDGWKEKGICLFSGGLCWGIDARVGKE